jgi:hypothetical protein
MIKMSMFVVCERLSPERPPQNGQIYRDQD